MENKLELLINDSFPPCSQKEIVGGVIMNISVMGIYSIELISLY